MEYMTIQQARKLFKGMKDDVKLYPSCLDVLSECEGDEDEDSYLMCCNEMCIDEAQYPIEQL